MLLLLKDSSVEETVAYNNAQFNADIQQEMSLVALRSAAMRGASALEMQALKMDYDRASAFAGNVLGGFMSYRNDYMNGMTSMRGFAADGKLTDAEYNAVASQMQSLADKRSGFTTAQDGLNARFERMAFAGSQMDLSMLQMDRTNLRSMINASTQGSRLLEISSRTALLDIADMVGVSANKNMSSLDIIRALRG